MEQLYINKMTESMRVKIIILINLSNLFCVLVPSFFFENLNLIIVIVELQSIMCFRGMFISIFYNF